jgi:hypothetical protein
VSLRLLLLLLTLVPRLQAAGADEKLAGEDSAAPTAVPTPAGDERGPILHLSRTAQAAPSFDLPAFVVTGSGERQALARREELAGDLDTSGGLKTSPGEQGAGKDQLEAQGGRESLEAVSGTSKPFVGGLRLSGGYQPTYAGSGYLAQELGAWSWSLDGQADSTQGGAITAPMKDPALRDGAGLNARAGWRGEDGKAVNAFVHGAYASRAPEPYLAGETAALKRGQWDGGLDAQADFGLLGLRARARGGQASAFLFGTDATEDLAGLDLSLSRRFSGRTGSAFLQLDLGVDSSSLASAADRRTRQILTAALTSHFEAGNRTHLALGLGLDAALGDDQAMQLGPRVQWEQRLGGGLSLQAGLNSGLRLSRLQEGPDGLQPWRVPDASLKPARLTLDGKAELHWHGGPWSASVGGFMQQGEDWFQAQSLSTTTLALDSAVRGWRLLGLTAGAAWQRGAWRAEAKGLWQRAELPDLPALATFLPGWSAEGTLAYAPGPWSAQLSLLWTGPRQAAADGSLPMDPAADLRARVAYDLNEAWSFYAEGRDLAGQSVQPAPYYPDPAPYVGLGVEYRF